MVRSVPMRPFIWARGPRATMRFATSRHCPASKASLRAKMRIAGKEVGGARVIEVRNPYTSALVGTVPKATVDDIRAAFAVARGYRAKLTRYERSEILAKAAALIRARGEAISDLITAES